MTRPTHSLASVLQALAAGPCVSKVLADRMGISYAAFGGQLSYWVTRGLIAEIGLFAQAVAAEEEDIVAEASALGRFTNGKAPVYALCGTPQLPPLPAGWSTPRMNREALAIGRRKKAKGKPAGRITIGRGSVWGAGLV